MFSGDPIPAAVEEVATACVDAGFQVHKGTGPGFKELIYHRAFCLELHARGLSYESEKRIDVRYKSWRIPGQKVDLLVEGVVLIEIKAVPKFRKIYRSQVLSYLKTLDLRLGLFMNFNTRLFRDGVKRIVL